MTETAKIKEIAAVVEAETRSAVEAAALDAGLRPDHARQVADAAAKDARGEAIRELRRQAKGE